MKFVMFPLMCHQFEASGTCDFARCCYAHSQEEIEACEEQIKQKAAERKKQKNGVCHEFKLGNTCRFGAQCRFTHSSGEEAEKIESYNQHRKELKRQKELRREERRRKEKEEKRQQRLELHANCHDENKIDGGRDDEEQELDDCYHQNFPIWAKRLITSSKFYEEKQALLDRVIEILISWKLRFADDPAVCTRIFKRRGKRLLKELEESILVIERTMKAVDQIEIDREKKVTIIDLCSGFGYTSMLLSELLPPAKVCRIVLIDKDFPHHSQAHNYSGDVSVEKHINWTHLLHPDWPVTLIPRKNNIKKTKREFDFIARNYLNESPVFILAIHLCGTLSLRACDLFNKYPSVTMIVLKPCCLPSQDVARQQEYLGSGSHMFKASDVCTAGKWSANGWEGPPRHLLGIHFLYAYAF